MGSLKMCPRTGKHVDVDALVWFDPDVECVGMIARITSGTSATATRATTDRFTYLLVYLSVASPRTMRISLVVSFPVH